MEIKENWDYEVKLTDLQTADTFGNIVRRQRATVDGATGEVLGIVSPRYQLVQNKTLHETMQEVIKESELGLGLEKVDVCKNRGVTIFRYGFGKTVNKIITSDTPNDEVKFGIEVINSFDGRLGPSKFRAFAERLVCTNGMTMPRAVAQFTFRSLGDLGAESISTKLARRVSPICATASVWEQWAKVTPSRIRVGEFISNHFNKKTAKSILEDYDKASVRSIWSLYNLVTAYISHKALAKNPEDTRVKQYYLESVANKFYTESFV